MLYLLPFLKIGVIHPLLSSVGKYPWLMHRLKTNDKGSLSTDIDSLRTKVEILCTPLQFLRDSIADSISLPIIGFMKNELGGLFFRKDNALILTGLIFLIVSRGILAKKFMNRHGTSA